VGLILDPSAALEDNDIYPIPSDSNSATGQVGVPTGVSTLSALPGSGVSEQLLPCVPE